VCHTDEAMLVRQELLLHINYQQKFVLACADWISLCEVQLQNSNSFSFSVWRLLRGERYFGTPKIVSEHTGVYTHWLCKSRVWKILIFMKVRNVNKTE
jgi:hypothetical protein